MDPKDVKQLEQFVSACKRNPAVLQLPELAFFRDWLQRYGF